MAKKLLSDQFSEPLNGATTARVDIHAGDGNLTIDRLDGEQALASGILQYLENQAPPKRTLVSRDDQASLSLRGTVQNNAGPIFPGRPATGRPNGKSTSIQRSRLKLQPTATAATSS